MVAPGRWAPGRWAILYVLDNYGDAFRSDIIERVKAEMEAVSITNHLGPLVDDEMISKPQHGRYSITDKGRAALIEKMRSLLVEKPNSN